MGEMLLCALGLSFSMPRGGLLSPLSCSRSPWLVWSFPDLVPLCGSFVWLPVRLEVCDWQKWEDGKWVRTDSEPS